MTQSWGFSLLHRQTQPQSGRFWLGRSDYRTRKTHTSAKVRCLLSLVQSFQRLADGLEFSGQGGHALALALDDLGRGLSDEAFV